MPNDQVYLGIGSLISGVENVSLSYHRAKNALSMAMKNHTPKVTFDEMGIYRLLYSVNDSMLLSQIIDETLAPVIEYDKKHNSNYIETLQSFLNNNCSFQATAEELFTHRNTVIYRITNIKKLLGTNFDFAEDKMRYQIALYAYSMIQ